MERDKSVIRSLNSARQKHAIIFLLAMQHISGNNQAWGHYLTRGAQLLDVKLKKSNWNTIKTWRNTCDMSLGQQLKINPLTQNKTQWWYMQHHTNITYYRNILCMHVYVPTAQSTDDFISDMSRSGQKQHTQQMWRGEWSNWIPSPSTILTSAWTRNILHS